MKLIILFSCQGIDNENDAAYSMVTDNTARLTSAVNSLPQLLDKKRLIDMHTTVATGETAFFIYRMCRNRHLILLIL
jgi:hypothetical protein